MMNRYRGVYLALWLLATLFFPENVQSAGVPKKVETGKKPAHSWQPPDGISAGWRHSCAVDNNDGQLSCWGSNSDGQSSVPTSVTDTMAFRVGSGESHTCALMMDTRQVQCWGADGVGQSSVPEDLGGLPSWR